MYNRFLDFAMNIFENFIAEIGMAITLFALILCREIVRKLRSRHKLKAESVVWSPAKKKVCYLIKTNGKREINIYNVNAGELIKVAVSIADGQLPEWSPDGRKLAFVSDQDGNKEIYVVDADGSNLRRITDDPAEDVCPQWSDDSTKLTFFTRNNGFLAVKTVDID